MRILLSTLFLSISIASSAQAPTRRDSLHGGLRPERLAYNVTRYDLNIKVDPDKQYVAGYNDITFKLQRNQPVIQVDLFENMIIDSIIMDKKRLAFNREFGAVFINLPQISLNTPQTIRFHYSGRPLIAKNAPWDGGFVYNKDSKGKHWVGVAVQGTGASLWFPCKDSQTDEPELGTSIKVAVPNGLMNVSNGRFLGSADLKNGYTRWDWEVKSPINNYDITLNIADYVHIHDNHNGLDLDYYVLRDNEAKARVHFEEVKPMMTCFESKFGRFPFFEDGYKLVETSYLGMEHQSAVAYGNNYVKGYRGRDYSGSGLGLLFDYIIIHETGHEWFGNSITSKDIADMWIHEGFTTYTEAVFVECQYGYDKAMQYVASLRKNVQNRKPVIGEFGVNRPGSGDMYPKGAVFLNTLRHVLDDDKKWWETILKFSETYKHQIIDTETVEQFFSREFNVDLKPVFKQYLRTTDIPELVLSADSNKLSYQWKNVTEGFAMPVYVFVGDQKVKITPTAKKQVMKITDANSRVVSVPTDKFYIKSN